MAKTKSKKKRLAEHVNNKKKNQTKLLNPFEVHINKEKMKVLGKKSKNDRGLPGISRAKALRKRKHTLLQEFNMQDKSNKFMDKRIGEKNSGLSEEDRAMSRFIALRVKAHKKKSIFNLADDEVLTHRGQTLTEIEKFDDPRSDDEESLSGDTSRKLYSDFVEEAHFGGGVLSKTEKEGAKTHKDLINQLIAESKKRKAEQQKNKEKTLELTEKLDSEWKDLIPLMNKTMKQPGDTTKTDVDDYDKAVKELKFEARGHPSDRLKSEDEIAKEEKERLEKLEKERLGRMKGFLNENTQTKNQHRSADDLQDDFAYDSEPEFMLSYNEKGESNIVLPEEKENLEIENKEESESEAETASEDDLSDLKEESSDSESEEGGENQINKPEKDTVKKNQGVNEAKSTTEDNSTTNCSNTEEAASSQEKIKNDLLKRKEIMEKARTELPYTFNLPESYKELLNTFNNQPPANQGIIIERMIKCNHPSLNESNKEKLGSLFVYLLQYINDIAVAVEDVVECFKIYQYLVPQFYELAQLNPENTQSSMIQVIKEKHMDYRKSKKVYPSLDILLFLKLVGFLFPTSDFRHPVVTPCIVFIDQMLYKCRIRTKRDISYGVFLVTLFLEYTALSKRYLPSAVSFLAGVLHMAIPKSGVKLIKVLPPFKATSSALVLLKTYRDLKIPLMLEPQDLIDGQITEDFKARVFSVTLKLVQEFMDNFKELPSFHEILERIFEYLLKIPTQNYAFETQNEMTNIIKQWEKLKSTTEYHYIIRKAEKPKALRLYEPNIQKVFDTKTHKYTSREKAERAKLLHKLKREKKGALREIRKDKAFLGRIKIKQRIQSDMERQEKVKRIFSEASIQQSELNALDRKKKRKK